MSRAPRAAGPASASAPLDASSRGVTVLDLVRASGLVPRRALRKRRTVRFQVGEQVWTNDDVVPVPSHPLEGLLVGIPVIVAWEWPALVALHKPPTHVTSRVAEGPWPPVTDLLHDHPDADALRAIGRLDAETSGLLLFTSDGALLQRLAHPRRALPRTYLATLARAVAPDRLEALRRGELELRDGHRPQPRELRLVDDDGLRVAITLTEGRYHEVRRAFAAAGSHVDALHRTSWGPATLEPAPPVSAGADAACSRQNPLQGLGAGAWRSIEPGTWLWDALWGVAGLEVPAPSLRVRVRGEAPDDLSPPPDPA